MDKIIDKLLKILRKQIHQNNEEIRFNQEEINHLLSDNLNPEKQKDLDIKSLINKELLDENAEIINFQLVISEFMEKYGYLFDNTEGTEENNDEDEESGEEQNCFKKTVTGKIVFDKNHPQFRNPGFISKLIKYYEEREDYEMCDKLMKMIKNN